MTENFLNNINCMGINCFITGGQAFKKYFNENEITTDFDIHIYITSEQLNTPSIYQNIYNEIKILYNNLKKNNKDLLPLTKFDYAKYSKKYIDKSLLNKEIEYYSSNIICDIQINSYFDTLFDISISYTPYIEKIKDMVGNDYYIKKKYLIKELNNLYDALINENKDKNKITKIKRRLSMVKS